MSKNRRLPIARVATVTAALVVLVLSGTASAFDPYPWAKDDINTCFTNHSWWTATRASEANAAVTAWETQVPGLNINHNPNIGQCSTSTEVEMNWVEHLDGSFGLTTYGTSGPIHIEYAQRRSAGGALIPYSYDDTPASTEFDFRSLVGHELGHALGLRHPEFDTQYPYYSFDGKIPVMKAESEKEGVLGRRTFRQDDLHGGWWSGTYDRSGGRQYFPDPGADVIRFWEPVLDTPSIIDEGSYIRFTKSAGTYASSIWKRVMFTTDNRQERETPTIEIKWREISGSNGGHVQLRFYFDPSAPNGASDIYSPVSYVSDWCYDTNADQTWETCTVTMPWAQSWEVQGMYVEIINATDAGLHVDDVTVVDDDSRP